MSDLSLVQRHLKDLNTVQMKALAKRAGVHWQTIYQLATGRNTNPTVRTLERLVRAIARAP